MLHDHLTAVSVASINKNVYARISLHEWTSTALASSLFVAFTKQRFFIARFIRSGSKRLSRTMRYLYLRKPTISSAPPSS